ncbi:TPA: TcpE family conjugal transfer membrane protein [Enterococcus faecium]|uniref:TcpE family conjugal transfer membrane protein n=1 Tax=Enterococcus faecium TaxID=1352 RepID=UPI00100DA839|nr:TcpE family conjugal transfer membrane protein [Enterococcus faecium]EMF0445289.1 conjugal transfer protein [Enterococcus faecium]MDT2316581.1 TcpE family conjugal transfer membrane protein [Enterococcus faecium]MDW3672322.1 TcpE family conjugal transfer membrane protein [Enterococcus faecium]RXW76520.1 conjugal transfer protein [Enterococcus faecium]TKN48904.1 conjugal transfer protein [Enterococcus faecium]
MNKEKQVFDYKEPFQAPYMVREITKKLRLRNAVPGQTIFVFGFTALLSMLILYPLLGFTQFFVILCLIIPYGMVELFNRVEPDGKKVHLFLLDYIRFVCVYQIGKKVIQQTNLITIRKTKMIYKKEQLNHLKIKNAD